VEFDPGPPSRALAQPIPAVAHRNLLRRQDAANWISGILGVSLAGTRQSLEILEVDVRDAAARASSAEELIGGWEIESTGFRNYTLTQFHNFSILTVSRRQRTFK
jgi:hypothetical protein